MLPRWATHCSCNGKTRDYKKVSDTDELNFESRRRAMVMIVAAYARLCVEELGKEQLSDRVMQAMTTVPRHQFVPAELEEWAYEDTPLPIGQGKTISQPFIVALMTDLLAIKASDKVLEIGTGLGYQSAILAELASQVFSVEIIEELAKEAERRLRYTGYDNVQLRVGDGSRGWVEHGPFDKIMVCAAPEHIPQKLLAQLKGGRRKDGASPRGRGRSKARCGRERGWRSGADTRADRGTVSRR